MYSHTGLLKSFRSGIEKGESPDQFSLVPLIQKNSALLKSFAADIR